VLQKIEQIRFDEPGKSGAGSQRKEQGRKHSAVEEQGKTEGMQGQMAGVEKFLSNAWQAKSEKDLQEMSDSHEKLINLILTEEEELIGAHRGHIDSMVGIVKGEMGILHEVDQPGSDVDEYTSALRKMLDQKLECIMEMKNRLDSFASHLRLEEEISRKFYKLQAEILDLDEN
jgi:hypothetical protein